MRQAPDQRGCGAKGYGCQCAAKAKAEEAERAPLPGQISIEDFLKDMEE